MVYFFMELWLSGKESACMQQETQETWVGSWVRKIPWRRERLPIPVLLPEKSYGQRSLASYHPGGFLQLRNHRSHVKCRLSRSCLRTAGCTGLGPGAPQRAWAPAAPPRGEPRPLRSAWPRSNPPSLPPARSLSEGPRT